MPYHCFKCGTEQALSSARPGRTESCSACRADLHCCVNCTHYDKAAYNQCRESQAERVVEKERSNFCDYFRFHEGRRTARKSDASSATIKKLDDLFKK